MAGYGWTTYDVRKGGTQVINDTGNSVDMVFQFAKISDDERYGRWGLRVKGLSRSNEAGQKTSVIFYLGSEDPGLPIRCGEMHDETSSEGGIVCNGKIVDVGNYKLKIPNQPASSSQHQRFSLKSLKVSEGTIWQAKSIFLDHLKDSDSYDGLIANYSGSGNLHFAPKTFEGDFEFDILFSSDQVGEAMDPQVLNDGIIDASSTFISRFSAVYSPQPPFQGEQHVKFSQSLLSNLLGGIGYFHGTSKVDVSSASVGTVISSPSSSQQEVQEQGPHTLITAVPSRPFFPRGFLWDEGFHLQVIIDWDLDLAMRIASSWFDLMDENGWIAREQILGPEARSKVPPEFQTQNSQYANPPTLFLVVQAFSARLSGAIEYTGASSQYVNDPTLGAAFLRTIYAKMKRHYEWFRRTQAGNLTHYKVPGSEMTEGYRWRGRTAQHVLTSGLDDYPRARVPHAEELHVDALAWVGSMAMALKDISAFLREPKDEKLFSKHAAEVLRGIDGMHWSDADRVYCDTTIVGSSTVEKVCHKGYVSLLPFLVGLVGQDHAHLAWILYLIRDPEQLWSPHGIRSLSLQGRYYGTGENYWRGPVWININYMVLQRLLDLAQQPFELQAQAHDMYVELRRNLVTTVFKSWNETGFAWEQYNPDTGKGQRTQHFTGWTALIVRIMAMPDLGSGSQPQPRNPIYHREKKSDRNMLGTLSLLGMLLFLFTFRNRLLLRFWRRALKA